MVEQRTPNHLTFYKIMTDDLNVWNSNSEYEDKIGDGRSTFISKKEKHRMSDKIIKMSHSIPLTGTKSGGHGLFYEDVIKMLYNTSVYDKKSRSRNNQKRNSKVNSRISTKSTEVETTSLAFSRLPTLSDYFPRVFL